MDRLAAGAHPRELCDEAGAGLGAFGVLDAVEERVAVAQVELVEEGAGFGVGVECFGEVGGTVAVRLES